MDLLTTAETDCKEWEKMAQDVVHGLALVIQSLSSCECTICALNMGATRGVEL
jgi:hypothetical protein